MPLHTERVGDATLLELRRPEKAHAYTPELLGELEAAIGAVETHVVVVASSGERAFCAGADLERMKLADPADALELLAQRVFDRLARAPFVSIAAVQGAAVGGGFELAMACDLRVAGPRARFWLPETGLGLIPAAGGCSRLPALVGQARARDVILGGRQLSASDALAWGLVSEVADDPRGRAFERAADVARRDPVALQLAKGVLDAELDASLRAERVAEAFLYGRKQRS